MFMSPSIFFLMFFKFLGNIDDRKIIIMKALTSKIKQGNHRGRWSISPLVRAQRLAAFFGLIQ